MNTGFVGEGDSVRPRLRLTSCIASGGPFFSVLPEKKTVQPLFLSLRGKEKAFDGKKKGAAKGDFEFPPWQSP